MKLSPQPVLRIIWLRIKNPLRDKLITIVFGLHLSGEEAQTMLKLPQNQKLYVREEHDIIILFCLQHKMIISDTNSVFNPVIDSFETRKFISKSCLFLVLG